MTADYTRDTFRPEQNFSAVRQQQGRVHLDADWNEQVDIGHHVTRTTNNDVIGPTGMPEAAPGFAIAPLPTSPGADLLIGAGGAYVDGILVEYGTVPTTLTKISGNGVNTIWEVSSGPRLAAGQWIGPVPGPLPVLAKVASIEPPVDGDQGRQRVKFDTALPAGDSQTVTALASALVQPYLPGVALPGANGSYLAYLDVWEREITALDDAYIAEVALGGPDSALRSQVVWQVKILPLQPLINSGELTAPPMCKSFPAGWTPDKMAPLGLIAKASEEVAEANPCELPAAGGYRSLENHFYRVEVHRGGTVGTDTILLKWSRDNAIHRSRLLDVANGSLIVEDIGRDDATAFATDDWLEVLDEGRILRGEPGFFVEIGEVIGTRLGIRTILDPVTQQPVLDNGEPDADVLPTRGVVRRWEGGQPVAVVPGTALTLERGIEVTVPAAAARAVTGMYWQIAARTLTATIEWPADPASGEALALPPKGISHAYCPLAILTKSNAGWSVADDCRPIFPPLTKLESFFYLGGDGQEAMPDPTSTGNAAFVALDSPLRVGVARGRFPVKGRPVRFRVTDPAVRGKLTPAPGTDPGDVIASTATDLVLRTNADGVAAAAFAIPKDRHQNHVLAELLNASDPAQADEIHLPIHFTATTSVASEVAYDPKNCAYQQAADIAPGLTKTVQDAIDKLCPRLEVLPLGGDSQTLCAGKKAPLPLTVGVFWGKQPLKGIKVTFKVLSGDAAVQPGTALTNDQGIATAEIVAGTDTLKDVGIVVIEATADGPIVANPKTLVFGARFLNAQCVYVNKDVCPPGQAATGSNTVADLISFLCKTSGGGKDDKGLHVLRSLRAKSQGSEPNSPLVAYEFLAPELLASGLAFHLDGPIDKTAIANGQAGDVILDLIFPVTRPDIQFWWRNDGLPPRDAIFARRPTKLDGTFNLTNTNEGSQQGLLWKPSETARKWLQEALRTVFNREEIEFRVPAQAVLYGNRIYSQEGEIRYLDGNLFMDHKDPNGTGVRYPSGDGVRGGDFVLPFYVGEAR